MEDKFSEKVKGLFASIHKKYDIINSITSFNQDKRWREKLANQIYGDNGLCVLDVCSGTGKVAREIYRRHKRKVIGLDFSFEMMKEGTRRDGTGVGFVVGNVERMPFRDGSMGGVTVAFGIRNIGNLEKSINEIRRVLADNGTFAVLEFSRPRNKILRFFHSVYLRVVVSIAGGLISGAPDAYIYLKNTIESFMGPDEIRELCLKARFTDFKAKPMTFGAVTIYVMKK